MRKTTKLLSVLLTILGLTAGSAHADLLGAGIGGLIGSQFGRGDGKLAMTAIGAVVGDRITSAPRQVVVQQGGYGYAQPAPYAYQANPNEYYEQPEYQYVPPAPVVVRVPAPVYYPSYNYNYAYHRERPWGREYYGYGGRGYGYGGRGYEHHERHYH